MPDRKPHSGCPDGGTCHHSCTSVCYRVRCCGPLSGTYPGDRWPAEIRVAHRVALRQVVWRDESAIAAAGWQMLDGISAEPPPWPFTITRFAVVQDGAVLHLWFTLTPAHEAVPGGR